MNSCKRWGGRSRNESGFEKQESGLQLASILTSVRRGFSLRFERLLPPKSPILGDFEPEILAQSPSLVGDLGGSPDLQPQRKASSNSRLLTARVVWAAHLSSLESDSAGQCAWHGRSDRLDALPRSRNFCAQHSAAHLAKPELIDFCTEPNEAIGRCRCSRSSRSIDRSDIHDNCAVSLVCSGAASNGEC